MKKLQSILAILVFSITGLTAQDMHLSNYQPAGQFFNPAFTAMSDSDVRVGVQYRNQWSGIPEAYTTMGAMGEMKYKNLGFGINVHQNKAGEASLKTTGVMLTGAYQKRLAKDGILSLGVGLGRMQKRINPSLLTFDNQYSEGLGYDAGLSSNENFTKTTAGMTDVTIGLLWNCLLYTSPSPRD